MMNNYEIDETAWKKNFSDMLQRLMGKRNISINKLAAEILVDPKSIRNYIDKKSVPSAIILKKLADYFEVSTDSLIQSQDRFSGQTIAALAVILRDFDVSLVKADKDAVTLQFNDNVLAAILEELYFSRGKKDYAEIVETLSLHYGSMQTMNQHLVDYITFRNLMRHEYIYHGLEEDIRLYTDENGDECYGIDSYTVEEIEKRTDNWDNMSQSEQDAWYREYQKQSQITDSDSDS
ncbi:MAG: helix-turn-helix domain-containing protein [Ruminococcus callidus]|uniref:helix-turn-helix domain-containing protein n=1 Tax=Ruminococcus callidus TaxID=40519 RepID=UPI0039A13183